MKKYTKLGLLAGGIIVGLASLSPLATYADTSSSSNHPVVSVTVNPIISVDSTDSVSVVTDREDIKTTTFNADVIANKSYTISLSTAAGKTALASSDTNNTESIPASSTVTKGQNGWGIKKKANDSSNDVGNYIGLTDTPEQFYKSTSGTSSLATTKFTIGVAISPTLSPGNYSTNIIVTAATI